MCLRILCIFLKHFFKQGFYLTIAFICFLIVICMSDAIQDEICQYVYFLKIDFHKSVSLKLTLLSKVTRTLHSRHHNKHSDFLEIHITVLSKYQIICLMHTLRLKGLLSCLGGFPVTWLLSTVVNMTTGTSRPASSQLMCVCSA